MTTKPIKLLVTDPPPYVDCDDSEEEEAAMRAYVDSMVPYEGDYDIIDFEPYEESDAS